MAVTSLKYPFIKVDSNNYIIHRKLSSGRRSDLRGMNGKQPLESFFWGGAEVRAAENPAWLENAVETHHDVIADELSARSTCHCAPRIPKRNFVHLCFKSFAEVTLVIPERLGSSVGCGVSSSV